MAMTFAAKGTPIAQADFESACQALGGDAASLWSLVSVETRGFGYLPDRRPQILFERHIFARRTNNRFNATHPDISNPVSGGYAGGAAEYGRLAQAMQLDETAALESASWGLGQVMGFNATAAGFADVQTMVNAMVANEAAQLRAVVGFIAGNASLLSAFKTRVWETVALHYNGANFADNHYDQKLRDFHATYSKPGGQPSIDLRAAQACLTYLGFEPRGVDGLMGPGTRAALMKFRTALGLPAGELDAPVMQQLKAKAGI